MGVFTPTPNIQADGALAQKLATYERVMNRFAAAIKNKNGCLKCKWVAMPAVVVRMP